MRARESRPRRHTCAALVFRIDGIMHVEMNEGRSVGLAEARELLHALREVAEGERPPTLVNLGMSLALTRDARMHLASRDAAAVQRAMGLLVGSPLTHALATFFIALNKPDVPTQLFTDRAAALAWLNGFTR